MQGRKAYQTSVSACMRAHSLSHSHYVQQCRLRRSLLWWSVLMGAHLTWQDLWTTTNGSLSCTRLVKQSQTFLAIFVTFQQRYTDISIEQHRGSTHALRLDSEQSKFHTRRMDLLQPQSVYSMSFDWIHASLFGSVGPFVLHRVCVTVPYCSSSLTRVQ